MEFARKYKERLVEAYIHEGKSTYQIAEELNTYATKVQKALKYLGVPLRDYKAAQKTALQTGRAEHPTQGKKLSEKHKRSVGRARSTAWSKMTDAERERVSNISKAQWQAMPDHEKAELRRLAAQAVRETSKEGSRTEKFVVDGLRKAGYTVNFHVKNLVQNTNLEVDMFLPEIRTAIEIDGPAHFLPIWGQESLEKHQKADLEKEGLLLSNGYKLIRVKQLDRSMSVTKMEKILDAVLATVKKIEKSTGKSKKIINIEVINGEVK